MTRRAPSRPSRRAVRARLRPPPRLPGRAQRHRLQHAPRHRLQRDHLPLPRGCVLQLAQRRSRPPPPRRRRAPPRAPPTPLPPPPPPPRARPPRALQRPGHGHLQRSPGCDTDNGAPVETSSPRSTDASPRRRCARRWNSSSTRDTCTPPSTTTTTAPPSCEDRPGRAREGWGP